MDQGSGNSALGVGEERLGQKWAEDGQFLEGSGSERAPTRRVGLLTDSPGLGMWELRDVLGLVEPKSSPNPACSR